MSDDKPVAVVIVNYNMPEAADAIYEWIRDHVKWTHETYLVDNGSDLMPPSQYTNVALADNVQTVPGWMRGLDATDLDSARMGFEYYAYWLIVTSAEFPTGQNKPLTKLVKVLDDNPDAVIVHPVLQKDSGTVWRHMEATRKRTPRQVHHADHIAMLVRADWFNSVGRLDERLYMAHGTCLETCWKARRDGRTIWMHEGVKVNKNQDIGHKMDRMGMTAEERLKRAKANMDEVLIPRYGPNYWYRLQGEYGGKVA